MRYSKIPRYGISRGTDYDIAVHRRKLIRVVVDAKRSYENLRSGVLGINSVYEGLRGKLIVFVFGVFGLPAHAHTHIVSGSITSRSSCEVEVFEP